MVHVLPHWTWPGLERPSTGPAHRRARLHQHRRVGLLLNGPVLGQGHRRYTHGQWTVPTPGELGGAGLQGGKLVASQTVATTGPAASITVDTTPHPTPTRGDVAVNWS